MSFNLPENFLYTKDHEWALIDNKTVTVGITEFAKDQLGEVVYVDLPKVGQKLDHNQTFGVVESVKAVSDLYSPVAGSVIEVNSALLDDPSALNTDPNQSGWLIKIEIDANAKLDHLMKAGDYRAHIGQ